MNVAAFLFATTIIVGAISSGHGTRYILSKRSFQIVRSKNNIIFLFLILKN